MRKSFPIFAVGALLLLGSCSQSSSSTANSTESPTTTQSSTSVSTPTPTPTPVPLPPVDDYKQAILDLYNSAVTQQNYTVTYSSLSATPQVGVRRFTKNAFHSSPFSDDRQNRTNYAANANGVFTYELENGVVEATSNYLEDADGNRFTSVHDVKIQDRWGDKVDQYELYNPMLPIDSVEFTAETLTGADVTVNQFVIPNRILWYLIPPERVVPLPIDRCTSYARLGEDQKSIILFADATSSTATDYSYVISDIGSTSIPEVEAFLEAGGGPSLSSTSPVTPLFTAQNYTIYSGSTPIVYVNPNYSVNVVSNTGYVYINNNSLENGAGIYKVTRASEVFTLGDFVASSSALYNTANSIYSVVPSDILDSFEEDGDNKYKCETAADLTALHLQDIFGVPSSTVTSATITANYESTTITSIDFDLTIGGSVQTFTLRDFGTTSLEGMETFISSNSSSL